MGNTSSEVSPDSLPALGASPDSTIVAGFSAGSFMAHNLHVVYSDTFKGAGLVAGGSYHAESYYPLAGIYTSIFNPYDRDPQYLA
jgi:predicted esterase